MGRYASYAARNISTWQHFNTYLSSSQPQVPDFLRQWGTPPDQQRCPRGPGDSMPQGGPRLRAEDGKLNQVGGRVRSRRTELKMQQRSLLGRLADVTDGGWNPTPQEVLRIENGTRTVTDTEVVALAQALVCEPGWLLVGEP